MQNLKNLERKLLTLTVILLWPVGLCSAQTQGGTVVSWDDSSNLINVPVGLNSVISLTSSSYYTIAVKSDGTVAVWGQFYDDSITLPAGLNNVTKAAAGPNQSLALKADGTVVAWGDRYNSFGVQNVPVGLSGVVALRATVYDSFALKSDGTIVVWGTDAFGSAEIPAGLSNVVAIAARDYSAIALKCDGTVVPWGLQLQTGLLPAGLTNIVAIDQAGNNALALRSDGTVISWANDVPQSATNVIGIAVGGDSLANHNLALRSDGTLVSWGSNPNVPSWITNVVGMAANYSSCTAIMNDGSPLIFRQPFVQQTVFSGTRVLLNVGAAGQPYLAFQWHKNGTNVPNATNATLILDNVQLSDSGIYSVTVSNSMAATTSQNSTLTVITSPPILTSQPITQTCAVGSSTTLSVAADGSRPFTYQWQLNGTNLLAATNATLTLANLQLTNAGAYDVLVSNFYGSSISSSAVLTVMDFAAALNTTNLIWAAGGNTPWFVTTSSSHDGVSSVLAGDAVTNQIATLQTTVTGPATLTFWWYLSVYNGLYPTTLTLAANGSIQSQLAGSTGWRQQTCYLGAGTQSLTWTYTSAYPNTGWNSAGLDQVVVTGGGTAPIVLASTGDQTKPAGTNVTFSVTAVGTPPLYYQWFLNSNNIAGATNSLLTLTNVQSGDAGIYSVEISNDFDATSTNAVLTVNPSAPFILNQPTNQWVIPQGNANFLIVARGTSPLNYQWLFNGTNLPNATNAALSLKNVQASNCGKYSVLITNTCGSVTSSVVTLTVASVVAWNVNNYGQATVPYNLGSAMAVAGSKYNSLAVKTNGTIAAWGLGNTGATNIPSSLTNVIGAALADSLGLAVRNDGSVGWWGTSTQTNPIPGLSNITAVAASQGNFYLALQNNGIVTAWGVNSYGQTNAPSGLSNVVAIATGDYHSLALKKDGTVAAWGGNVKGTSGQATIPSGLTNIVAIAAGDYYSLAVKSDGSVVGFPTNNTQVVMRIPSGLSNVVAVAAAAQHALALTTDGTVWEWGNVGNGWLNGPSGLSNAVAIACGGYHSLANLSDGSPFIIRQPWSQTVYGGSSTTFSVGAVGASLSYQWLLDGAAIDRATNSFVAIANAQLVDAGSYSVVVTNSLGSITSSVAVLNVITGPPVISLQSANVTATPGSNVTFSASATGLQPIIYQWHLNGLSIPGATNTSLALTNVQAINAGAYSLVASNSYGTTSSLKATLFVLAAPAITGQPTNNTVIAGANVTFSVDVAGTGPFTYQWQFNGTNLPNKNNVITTVAGARTASAFAGDGGPATNAYMNGPSCVAIDAAGGLFITDQRNNRIRKVDINGIINTLAGGGYSGDGGMATNAGLNLTATYLGHFLPAGVALDAQGNFYIADAGNNRIRKVDTNGIISTIAGTNSAGFSGDGGLALNAKLQSASGVATDSSGNVFIADTGNHVIRKVDVNGIITTLAGNGNAGYGGYAGDGGAAINATLNRPYGVAVDSSGNVFIADTGNNVIRKVDVKGGITTLAGNAIAGYAGDGGTATNASLNQPYGVAVDAFDDVFIADYYNNRIRMVGLNGIITTVAGTGSASYSGGGGSATNAAIYQPTGVGVDSYCNLFFPGGSYSTVRKVDFGRVAALQLSNVAETNNGNYDVVVTSPYGSVTSSVVSLTVQLPPSITTQPNSLTVADGGSANFNVAVSGTEPLSYQWFTSSGRNATAVPSMLGSHVWSAIITDSGAGYSSVPQVLFVGGNGSGASGTAVVNNSRVTAINITNPGSYFGTPPTIQIASPSSTVNQPLSDQTNATLTLSSVTSSNATNYFVVVTNNYGSVTSRTVGLKVFLPPQSFMGFSPDGKQLNLQMTGTPNYPYILQTATNLLPPIQWKSTLTNPTDVNGNWVSTVTNLTGTPVRFYRTVGQ